jgi:hypothetical protein
MNKTDYISTMNVHEIAEIKEALIKANIEGEDLENALDSRIGDLEDTIDIKPYISK